MYIPPLWDREIYQEAVGILNGSVYYSSRGEDRLSNSQKTSRADLEIYVSENLTSAVVIPLCVPYKEGIASKQDMTNSELVDYLYERSDWIKKVFTFEKPPKGGRLDVPIGGASELFAKEELQTFSAEISRIAEPNEPRLKKEFINLRGLLKLALSDPDLTLVMAVV